MPKSVSIRKRLTWYVLVATIMMSLVTGVGVYRGTTHEADEIFDAALVQTARILDGIMTQQAIEANRHHLEEALERAVRVKKRNDDEDEEDEDEDEDEEEELHAYEKKLFFLIHDRLGKVLLKSPSAPRLDVKKPVSGFDEITIKNRNWITFTLQATDPSLWIIVGERSDVRKEVTEYIGSALLTPLVFVLPFVLFFIWRTVSLALKPLRRAVDELDQQDLKNLKKMTVDDMPLEIKPLLQAINQMVEKLDDAYQREKRFVSDASHELRNPLAALLINVDNALEENGDEDVGESLTSMKQSIVRLSHLISQLLLLSHSENPLAIQNPERVDLKILCQQVADSQFDNAASKNQVLEYQSTQETAEIQGVESLLVSLVTNLLDNAIKYCDTGCRIRLICAIEKGDIIIQIDDSGQGLSPELRAKVTGRFIRAGDQLSPGAGLGLSIAKSIAGIHSASMQLTDSELGGLCVRIIFERPG